MNHGFAAIYHNYSHSPESYSKGESLVRNVLLDMGFVEGKDFKHEFNVKVRPATSKMHNYWLDFYFPRLQLDLEVDPKFHHSFKPYLYACIRRTFWLRKYKKINTFRFKLDVKNNGDPKLTSDEAKELVAQMLINCGLFTTTL